MGTHVAKMSKMCRKGPGLHGYEVGVTPLQIAPLSSLGGGRLIGESDIWRVEK